jgi:Spy/CpxP family protein refolding chaperone
MNRIFRNTAAVLSLAGLVGALGLGVARTAHADDAAPHAHHGHHGHRQGLLGAALRLDSLTPDQRASIEQLIAQRRTARTPVRQADAQVLEVLAHQVEQASIDPSGLAPTLTAEKTAATAELGVERDTLNRLHSILSPAQRGALVDGVEAHVRSFRQDHADAGVGAAPGGGHDGHGLGLTPDQRAQIAANLRAEGLPGQMGQARAMLEAFRGDAFDASSYLHAIVPGEHAEHLAQAMVPVLTPAQRAQFANRLRTRASHESGS